MYLHNILNKEFILKYETYYIQQDSLNCGSNVCNVIRLICIYIYIYIYFKTLLMSILNISLIGNTDTYIIGINNYK